MSVEQNKEIARRIPLELFGQGRMDVVDELVSPEVKNHGDTPPGIQEGRDGLKAIAAALRKGFPDIKVRVDLQIAEGDYVVTTGQDGIYPPGLNVGTVVHVTHGSATQPHVIHVKPSARLDSLEEVAVLQYHPPQREPMEQALPNADKGKKK